MQKTFSISILPHYKVIPTCFTVMLMLPASAGAKGTYYTPFVRLEKGRFRHRDVRGIEPGNNQVPHLIPQLIAPSFEQAEKILSLFIEKGYKEVDINMGCPFHAG